MKYLNEERSPGVDFRLVELFDAGTSGGGAAEVRLHSNHPHRHLCVEHLSQPRGGREGVMNERVSI